MKLISTRNKYDSVTALEAVAAGIAEQGGLYVPERFPQISEAELKEYCHLDYPALAARVMELFFDTLEMEPILREAYASFDCEEIAPLRPLAGKEYILELFHGPTLAFKDMALQVLPRLMSRARADDKTTLILTATSGDTGKAALEGFADVDGIEIIVFYPEQGVSQMQKLQMVTQQGKNVRVCAVRGNFDDAQTAVKQIFTDSRFLREAAARGYRLSSANSINFGRLAPQIAYYFHAYARLTDAKAIRVGEKINFAVPTGNFGNILAAYYAKRMGLPVGKLICASNQNNVLYDFFHSGEYNANRTFFRTMSPSMDILISSNLERLIFEMTGRDDARTAMLMKLLSQQRRYSVDPGMSERLSRAFYAGWCDDELACATIARTLNKYGYLLDPHTAVAQTVYEQYRSRMNDETPTVVVATANPYKFAQDVLRAVEGTGVRDPFASAARLAQVSGVPIPKKLEELKQLAVLHTDVAAKNELPRYVLDCLK